MIRNRLCLLVASSAGAFALLAGASAQAATVTIGSSLGPNLSPRPFNQVGTIVQTALPGATLVAPFNGTITSWQVLGASGGPLKLRVVHPLGGNVFTGAGTAASGPITGPGVLTFQANLPIKAGDSIGLEPTNVGDTVAVSDNNLTFGFNVWVPPLADGDPGRAPSDDGSREVGFNATVVSNCIVPKVKGKKLKAAKKALRNAGCDPGKVKKPKRVPKKKARVRKQNPKAGTEVPAGTDVNLKLGRKR